MGVNSIKIGPLAGFNPGGQLGSNNAAVLANPTTKFDAATLGQPPFSTGLGLPQTLLALFDPTQLQGLDMWVRADLGIVLGTANRVTSWQDQEASPGRFFTNAGGVTVQPIWSANNANFNNQATIQFTAGRFLSAISSLTLTPGREVFVVCRSTSDAASNIFTDRLSTTYAQHSWPGGTGSAGLVWTDGVNAPNNATIPPQGINLTTLLNWSEPNLGSPLSFNVTGSPVAVLQTGGMSAETGSAGVQIGGTVGGLAGFVGFIAEIIVYYRQLLSAERALVTTYLRTRYAI